MKLKILKQSLLHPENQKVQINETNFSKWKDNVMFLSQNASCIKHAMCFDQTND